MTTWHEITETDMGPSMHRCSACGRLMPFRMLEPEWRHVGGRPDRLGWYCRAGYGHRQDEPRADEPVASPAYRARRARFLAERVGEGRKEDDVEARMEARMFEWVDGTHQQG